MPLPLPLSRRSLRSARPLQSARRRELRAPLVALLAVLFLGSGWTAFPQPSSPQPSSRPAASSASSSTAASSASRPDQLTSSGDESLAARGARVVPQGVRRTVTAGVLPGVAVLVVAVLLTVRGGSRHLRPGSRPAPGHEPRGPPLRLA